MENIICYTNKEDSDNLRKYYDMNITNYGCNFVLQFIDPSDNLPICKYYIVSLKIASNNISRFAKFMRENPQCKFIFIFESTELAKCSDEEIMLLDSKNASPSRYWHNECKKTFLKPSKVLDYVEALIVRRFSIPLDIPRKESLTGNELTFSQEEYNTMIKVMEKNDVLTVGATGVRFDVFFENNFLFVKFIYEPYVVCKAEIKRKNGEYYIDEIYVEAEIINVILMIMRLIYFTDEYGL